ncbi:MAG: hypothetical protein HOP19_27870, partial [Acidobacteria bacterium]|nr:hypothetical protein [Acidobacteriota bacterium]
IRRINNNALSSVAGTGANASSGDGSVATAAGLNNPIDVMVDAAGNLFVTEADGERVRRIEAADNKINTIAGTGVPGFGGDDGTAISALLNTPTGLARNSGGVIFFCDTGNLRVRRLTPSTTNRPPVPDTVVNQSLNKSQSVSVSLSAADADSDPVTFTLVPALSFVTVTSPNPTARTASLLINPAGSNVGVYTVRVQAADNKGATGLTPEFTITINDPDAPTNRAPIARANVLPQTVIAPINTTAASVNLDGSTSSDPDGDPLTYEWYDGNVKIAMTVTATVQLTVGTHSIRLEVVDNKNARGIGTAQTVTVRENTRNNPPVAVPKRTPTTDPIIATNFTDAVVNFDGTMSTDPDGDTITGYEWFRGDEATPSATTGTTSLTLPTGTHTIRLRVTDSRGAQSELTSLNFNIEAPPPDVVVSSITPSSARRGATVNVVILGTGFTTGSKVSVNSGGVNAITTSVTATRITATFEISSNALTGLRAISVNDLEAGRFGTSASRIFTINP